MGAPRPTQDAEFWKYVSHTWDMSRTYLSPRDLLLEEIQDQLYDETNIDFDDYWTSDRLQQQQEIRQKAKLRAINLKSGIFPYYSQILFFCSFYAPNNVPKKP